MSKLNDEYFKTKRVHKENYKTQKLSFKRKLINLIIGIALIFACNLLLKQCYNKIEQNKKVDKINETQNL